MARKTTSSLNAIVSSIASTSTLCAAAIALHGSTTAPSCADALRVHVHADVKPNNAHADSTAQTSPPPQRQQHQHSPRADSSVRSASPSHFHSQTPRHPRPLLLPHFLSQPHSAPPH
ncbi:hypothetical protein R3P38DRAFT_3236772 [Favolaschia claudopus]|uniref:Uncharacterized protein n=1 Tax=Favolaschia claudopus TaxID=2862362 RepID=A0AAV9ZC48_9AGAR